jgi:hypothetical protein
MAQQLAEAQREAEGLRQVCMAVWQFLVCIDPSGYAVSGRFGMLCASGMVWQGLLLC